MGGTYTAAEGEYGADADAALVKQYRDIFAEITAKAMPVGNDDVKFYVVPVGPIHRAAGKIGFQMFNGEHHLTAAVKKIAALTDALQRIAKCSRDDWEFRDGSPEPTWRLIASDILSQTDI